MDKFSYLNNIDPDVIEDLYKNFKENPGSVDESWRMFFEGYEFSRTNYAQTENNIRVYPDEFKVINLINAYRQRGHLFTKTNPVRARRTYSPTLDIENFDLTKSDLKRNFQAGNEIGIGRATLLQIVDHLNATYCQSIGAEYTYIRNIEMLQWLRDKMESTKNSQVLELKQKSHLLEKLTQAVNFEKFIHKRFPGQKRFSLEGAESLIPAMDAIIEKGADAGNEEFVIGLAHRGRLNILANILKKPIREIFSEFEGKEYDDETLLGDVKYHLGYTSKQKTAGGKDIQLTLSPNPSHLEAVNPVVEGIVRAKIDHDYNGDTNKITPILIHGDASIAGQGIVYEVIQMAGLSGYNTGGTIHLVINNQIGFTTNYLDARTSTYCTDIAKTIQSPVFHVNGDDVEAVVYAVGLAIEFRTKFSKDVFIDLLCYRKYGHNEGDEPRFTQPLLYKIIEKHPDPHEIYKKKLLEKGDITEQECEKIESQISESLKQSFEDSKKIEKSHITFFLEETWKNIRKAKFDDFDLSPDSSVSKKLLTEIGTQISTIPDHIKLFRKTIKLQDDRLKMIEDGQALDWAMGELLAYGSLLMEGIPIRLSGQDVARGTFSHRHAVLRLEDSEEEYLPLNHIKDKKASIEIFNSPLSEYGVLGFEYGYSLTTPHSLTIWEAQFGDFNNGAQIIIDQFLSSAEDKWNVMNDLVLLLPHGYEGQGPEHSSARLERFLILCAENNMQIVNCTTPANFFHVLRRQFKRDFRKPLIIFTPKSLLRHPKCVSPLADFALNGFKEVIDDQSADPDQITKVVFCSGKIYYDLLEEKQRLNNTNIALVRLEQIYPLPIKQLRSIIKKYKNSKNWIWVQEEPVNMGAWTFLHHNFTDVPLKNIARPASGSPATGSSKFHAIRQQKIIDKTFEECNCPNLLKECEMVCIGNKWRTFEKEINIDPKKSDSSSFSALKKL
ncbi:MAG: 2-oxoglutarate dehydrogenase E1 component [Bacteroidetes bacterium HGW-Bacteroidetes-17]|nr:MAG: 2-oxoglutarate dehydrogenase E1 component [Bacteroidetes bacterium HGW-Bacteroidetes-17]